MCCCIFLDEFREGEIYLFDFLFTYETPVCHDQKQVNYLLTDSLNLHRLDMIVYEGKACYTTEISEPCVQKV